MTSVGFESTISAGERPKTYALDRAATETGIDDIIMFVIFSDGLVCKCTVFLFDTSIYLLTGIRLSPGGSSTVHIYTQTIHRTIQNKQYIQQHNNFGRERAVPRLG